MMNIIENGKNSMEIVGYKIQGTPRQQLWKKVTNDVSYTSFGYIRRALSFRAGWVVGQFRIGIAIGVTSEWN